MNDFGELQRNRTFAMAPGQKGHHCRDDADKVENGVCQLVLKRPV